MLRKEPKEVESVVVVTMSSSTNKDETDEKIPSSQPKDENDNTKAQPAEDEITPPPEETSDGALLKNEDGVNNNNVKKEENDGESSEQATPADQDVKPEDKAIEPGNNDETTKVEDSLDDNDGNDNDNDGKPKDPYVGKTMERYKTLPSGYPYPLQGKIVAYQETSGRLPPRWSVDWPTTEDVTLQEEWIATDLAPEEGFAQRNTKTPLDTVQYRYQQHLEHALESSDLVSTLLMFAAMEEALQISLHQQQENAGTTTTTTTSSSKGSRQTPHPPLYYTSNPSSYLQPPTATDTTPSLRDTKVHLTPANMAQRVRTGCSWAWNYLSAQQPPAQPPVLPSTQRRSLRQPKPPVAPVVPSPTPVQRGGRVAMWWLAELEKEKFRLEKQQQHQQQPNVDTDDEGKDDYTQDDNSEKESSESSNNNSNKNNNTETERIEQRKESEMEDAMDNGDDDDEEEAEESEESDDKNDDEDYSAKDADIDEEEDEELEDVEKEHKGNLVSDLLQSSDEEGDDKDEEEDDDDDDDDDDILYENPFLKPTFPAFLEYLAKPKSLTGQDVQTALCESVLRVKHNKRSSNHGLLTSTLESVDQVVLDQETPDYPPGKVVLSCASGESFAELQRLDPNTFSRCKFTLDVVGDEEKTQQVQRREELLLQEAQFKEHKAWDKWRHKGIHEGFTNWPPWHDAISDWVNTNCTFETAPPTETVNQEESGETKDDEAIAKSLEESEASSGRRRTTRRAATSGASEGVFYGGQSQLTQKQLMDALLRLVKSNQFQTMMRLQSLVGDDSNDPLRRTRIGLGKLVWKRNQLVRKAVSSELSDSKLAKLLEKQPLVSIHQPQSIVDDDAAPESRELSQNEKDLEQYIRGLHSTELQLRRLVVKHLTEIPVAIVATAADERPGALESMDSTYFEDPSSIEWHASGHTLINSVIYRPANSKATIDLPNCQWYKIQDYSKSIQSEGEDGADDPLCVERRMRFRGLPIPVPGEAYAEEGGALILTEAQVYAGIKAAEMERVQGTSQSPSGNPFAGGSGDRVTLVPIDMDEGDGLQEVPSEIHARILAHDNVIDDDDDGVQYRILVLPEATSSSPGKAFWASLDVRADDSSYVCQPVGNSTTWYSIEIFDYHPNSAAFKECQTILNYLRRQSKAGPFLEPVDPVALNIPSYSMIVKNPMDISTVTDKLENGHYSSIPPGQSVGRSPVARMLNGPFRKDVELIFDNAMLFNPPGDWIYQAAAQLKKNVLKKIADASYAADTKLISSGRGRKKSSMYVDDDSDVDMYDYESDQDDEFDGGRRSRKRKRPSRGGTQKDDFSSRAVEHVVRLQKTMKDALDLKGPFANLPLNSDASSFALPPDWSCRRSTSTAEPKENKDPSAQKRAQEIAELLALQRAVEANEAAGLRRSTRAQPGPSNGSSHKSHNDGIEFFLMDAEREDGTVVFPSSRYEVEVQREKLHEEHYAKLYQIYSNLLSSQDESSSFGLYTNGSFPPYLGRIVPLANSMEASWEIRAPFVIPALRWVMRGLIKSGHVTDLEPLATDVSSGVIMTNDIYYWDANLHPFETLDLKELQRKKRANKDLDEESEEDIEMSEYEKMRAERVARNAERLKALGLV